MSIAAIVRIVVCRSDESAKNGNFQKGLSANFRALALGTGCARVLTIRLASPIRSPTVRSSGELSATRLQIRLQTQNNNKRRATGDKRRSVPSVNKRRLLNDSEFFFSFIAERDDEMKC